ncbi:MAG TPA: sulfur carrier protein ThiS, partial [Vicinamibacterales bacterium]|nr:sulfur carrier protein ThiS [Vicinamibacterales bacterium]
MRGTHARPPALRITLNGEPYEIEAPLTVSALLERLQIDARRVAVEHNLTVVRRAEYGDTVVREGDQIEIVNFVGGGSDPAAGADMPSSDPLIIAGREFRSRLIVGTGKYSSFSTMVAAHEASGAEMVTVAVRRVNLRDRTKESLLDYIDTSRCMILPNTAGCYTAAEAVRTARLAREAGLSNWVKLEVIGDERTLLPDAPALLEAAEELVDAGFTVLPYTNDDPILARR